MCIRDRSIIPWHKDNIAQVLITIQDESRYSSIVDPRNVLAKVWNSFSKLKFYPRVAFELEFYLIKRRNRLDENPIPPVSNRNNRQAEGTQVYGMSELDDFYDFLEEIMGLRFNTVLFDNMSIKNLKAGIKIAKKYYETEASGNINLKTVKSIAKTGVDRISVGSITHSVAAIDFKLEI